jgi:hypothetical protein
LLHGILFQKGLIMKLRFILLISFFILPMLACQAVSPDSGAEQPEESGSVLFQDDFSDPNSQWDRVNVADGITDYEDGAYRIFVNTANTDVWANPNLSFSDVSIEVDATKVGGDDNNDFGVICRYQDSANFYFFVISSDGYYGISKVVDGSQELIGMEAMPPSDVINTGNVSNHLRADCAGSTLRFFVNGELLGEFDDTQFTSGDVGLIAGSFDVAGVDILFDNFVVSKP